MLRVAVTGTRFGWTDAQEASIHDRMPREGLLRHGGCRGVDVQVARLVREVGADWTIICHPGPEGDEWQEDSGVDDTKLEPETHFARNRRMVDLSEAVWVVPAQMERQTKGGTWYTHDYAIKQGKKVVTFWPDGSVTETEPKGD